MQAAAPRSPWRPTARVAAALVAASALAAAYACVHDGAEPPPLSGPSELALSIVLSATPDILPLDGAAQSLVSVQARDENGSPIAALNLTVQIVAGAVFQDFGQLSARSVVTSSDGRAAFTYIAPLASTNPAGAEDFGATITIQVTPSSDDFVNNVGRTIVIRLVPPGTVIPPFGATAGFDVTPATPLAFDQTRFSAAYCAAGDTTSTNCVRDPNGLITLFSWDFGDGTTATGQQVAHVYETAATYLVRLTISDGFNRFAEATLTVTVSAAGLPTAAFTVSPAAPSVDDTVFFNASTSVPGTGRTLVSYAWDFGDGATGSGVSTSHVYTVEDTYNVTLTVTDDRGQIGTATQGVAVTDSAPVAAFVYSPLTPSVNQTIYFSASSSVPTNGRTIVEYLWIFGDGSATSDGPNTTHVYTVADEYAVQLFVTDDFGETGTTSQTITVGGTGATATAIFTFSPTDPEVGDLLTVDASSSTPAPGATILTCQWNFGDGTAPSTTTGPVHEHTYNAADTFTITLTVIDSLGGAGLDDERGDGELMRRAGNGHDGLAP